MDAKRAAEVLRMYVESTYKEECQAGELGAQALEAWAWVEREKASVTFQNGRWHCAVGWFTHTIDDSPLAAVLNAMEKEGKG